jgi:4a-hydroxytetrahydrobiopterin dehydratase
MSKRTLLTPEELASALATVPDWQHIDGQIQRQFSFPSYMDGIQFVQRVAQLAEAANHHPDIHIGWRKVSLALSTHSAKGLTQLDMELARKIDVLAGPEERTR